MTASLSRSLSLLALASPAVGLLACAPAPGAGPGAAAAQSAPSPFGIHELRLNDVALDEVAAMRDLGASSARLSPFGNLIWDVIETEKGVYDWSSTDAAMTAGRAAGLALFTNVGAQNRLEGTPPGPGHLPKDLDWYLAFLQKAVERYDGDGVDDAPGSPVIDVIQIGNEVDGPAFWQDTPENYALLLKRSYQAAKRVAPSIRVAIAGVATPAGYYGFYQRVLAELDRLADSPSDRAFDVFDLHWSGQFRGDDDYATVALPAGNFELRALVADVRADLARRGSGDVPVYITETSDYSDTPAGYPTHTESYHAAAIVKRYLYALSAGVEKIFWAQIVDSHDAGGFVDGYFDHVGLTQNPRNPGGASHKKLGFYTYKKLVELLDGSDWKTLRADQETAYVRAFRLSKAGRELAVAWWDTALDPAYTPGATTPLTLSGLVGSKLKITEVVPAAASGKEVTDDASAFAAREVTVSGGAATISLGERPVVVELLE